MAQHLDELRHDDELLTSWSKGIDPSRGKDPLAAEFLALREEIVNTTPAAPNLAAFGFDLNSTADPELLPDASVEKTENVVPLRGRRVSAIASGLIGAAAATLVIAGAGATIYSAGPDSPLYGMNQAIFGTEDTVVRLASKLDAADSLYARGDVEGAQKILDEVHALLETLSARERAAAEADLARMQYTVPPTVKVEVTTTKSVTAEPKPQETKVQTVTQVVTETNVVTVTVTPSQAPQVVSSEQPTTSVQPVTSEPVSLIELPFENPVQQLGNN